MTTYFKFIIGYECGVCLEKKRNCIQCFHNCSGYTCVDCICKCVNYDADSDEVIYNCPYCRQESGLGYKHKQFHAMSSDTSSRKFYSLIDRSNKIKQSMITFRMKQITADLSRILV
jgi:hypothetical protein